VSVLDLYQPVKEVSHSDLLGDGKVGRRPNWGSLGVTLDSPAPKNVRRR
jgi:hypothetical protein